MRKDIHEKNVVFAIVMIFLGLTVAPAVNAQIAGNDFNGTKSMVQKFSNTTVNCEDNSIYDLLILTPKKFVRMRHLMKYMIRCTGKEEIMLRK